MANQLIPAEVEPEMRPESSTGLRVAPRVRSHADAPTEELELLGDGVVDEPRLAARPFTLPSLPPLPVSANPLAQLEVERDRVSRLHPEQSRYLTELETVLARRSQELLEADEREAALVRRFHLQTLRIAELDRQVREQNRLIEQLQATLPKRPSEVSELLSIRGVGPKYARTLSALGIATVAALAAMSDEDVNRIEQSLRIRNGRIRRECWVEQAQQQLASRATLGAVVSGLPGVPASTST